MKLRMFVIGLALGTLWLLLVPRQTISLNKESGEKALARHRQRIDVLDKQIISLLNERARIALDIGRIRKRESIPPSSALGRQEEVLRNVMANSVPPLSREAARRIYERIIGEMVSIQALDRSKGAGRSDLEQER
ncbi:MAG TPA: chorismate mutase [Terriglobia bacterium]|nr:chorismate mutase [Terriglobia bacterium]